MNCFRIDLNSVAVCTLYHCSNTCNRIQKYINIINIWKVLNTDCLICHNCCSKNRKCRILRSTNLHLAYKRVTSLNNILLHR